MARLRPRRASARAGTLTGGGRSLRRFEFWRGFVDDQVRRYLDRGRFENGFARVRCPDCHAEYLLAFSCKTRDLCPSCAARRASTGRPTHQGVASAH